MPVLLLTRAVVPPCSQSADKFLTGPDVLFRAAEEQLMAMKRAKRKGEGQGSGKKKGECRYEPELSIHVPDWASFALDDESAETV